MKKLLTLLSMVLLAGVANADVKISQLPLGTASTTGSTDSFPYVNVGAGLTYRLDLSDLINLPSMVATYAPINNTIFTGVTNIPALQIPTGASNGYVLQSDGSGNASWHLVSGSGTVTSVAMTVPSWLTVTGSPIMTSGTFAIAGASQTGNFFLAAPNGTSGVMAPRAIVAADLPSTISSNTSGNAATVTTNANMTGDVTSSGSNVTTLATVATPGTSTKVTYNAKGLVTSGTTLASGDIPNNAANTSGTAANVTATTNTSLTTLSSLSLPGAQVSGNISGNAGGLTSTLGVAGGGTGAVTLATGKPLFGAGTSAVTTGTLSGNTTKLATSTGTLTSGDCVELDASGNYIDAGSACSSGGITALTGDVTASGTGSVAATVAKIAGVAVGTPSGTGNVLFSNSPTMVTPTLGTPASGVATHLTGLPLTTGVTEVLPFANGGTNNSSAYSSGSILFSNGTALTQDNNNFFWDDTNFGLRINADASTNGSGSEGLTIDQQLLTPSAGDMAGANIWSFLTGNTASSNKLLGVESLIQRSITAATTDTGPLYTFYANGINFFPESGSAGKTYTNTASQGTGGLYVGPTTLPSPAPSPLAALAITNMYGVNIAADTTANTGRKTALFVGPPTNGTNNAEIADNVAYAGSYALNLSSTNPSVLAGDLTLSGSGTGLTVSNNAQVGGFFGIGGGGASQDGIIVQNTLSGSTQQRGVNMIPTFNSSATIGASGFFSAGTTSAATFTLPFLADFNSFDNGKGSGSTITNRISFYTQGVPTTGTNNAILADNAGFTGNWFLNQSGTGLPSTFGSTLQFTGATNPANGVGGELSYGAIASTVRLLGFNRGTSARVPVLIDGSTLVLDTGGTAALSFDSSQNATFSADVKISGAGTGLNVNTASPNTSFVANVTGNAGSSNARTALIMASDTTTGAIGGVAPTVQIENTSATANNYSVLSFADAAGSTAAAIITEYTDQTNGYGNIGFITRGAGGYVENFEIGQTGTMIAPNIGTSTAALDYLCWNSSTGAITGDASGTCLASTIKVKENVKDLDEGLGAVMALHPISFDYKKEYSPRNLGNQVGFIAEEVVKVDPRLATKNDKTGELNGVRYSQMTAVLVKAMQEQQAEIEALKTEIKELRESR